MHVQKQSHIALRLALSCLFLADLLCLSLFLIASCADLKAVACKEPGHASANQQESKHERKGAVPTLYRSLIASCFLVLSSFSEFQLWKWVSFVQHAACCATWHHMLICSLLCTVCVCCRCRFCCHPAVWFCFGTTHFCNACHEHPRRVMERTRARTKQCPGPSRCPSKGDHAPNGPDADCEHNFGCGVCQEKLAKKMDEKRKEEKVNEMIEKEAVEKAAAAAAAASPAPLSARKASRG